VNIRKQSKCLFSFAKKILCSIYAEKNCEFPTPAHHYLDGAERQRMPLNDCGMTHYRDVNASRNSFKDSFALWQPRLSGEIPAIESSPVITQGSLSFCPSACKIIPWLTRFKAQAFA
jgi:hypothetical protein